MKEKLNALKQISGDRFTIIKAFVPPPKVINCDSWDGYAKPTLFNEGRAVSAVP